MSKYKGKVAGGDGLFVAEGDDGIDAGSAARGNEARGQCDEHEKGGDGADRQWIVGVEIVEHGFEIARYTKGDADADRNADERQNKTLFDDETQNVADLRTEGHARADFMGAARDFIRQQAIQADAGEEQSEQTEKAREAGDETLLKEEAIDLFGLGADLEERQILIELGNDFADGRQHGLRVGGSANFE